MKERGKLSYLFVCLLFTLFVYPFVEKSMLSGKILAFFFTLVLASSAFAVSVYKRRNFMILLSLAVPTIILVWVEQVSTSRAVDILTYIFITLFSFFTMFCIVSHIMRAKKVTTDILSGAASAYLLIGMSWGMLCAILEYVTPGSFTVNSAIGSSALQKWSTFNYYSFTTLTTLGYGDITAVTARAQSFAVLEAVTGVLFVALLISRLVGMYAYQLNKEN